MTTTLFGGKPGHVVVLDPDQQAGSLVKLAISSADNGTNDAWGGFAERVALVSSIGISRHVKLQVRQMFSDDVYVYVFGEGIADIVISGVIFPKQCDDGSTNANDDYGIDRVMEFFDTNAAHNREEPLVVAVGKSRGFAALLVSMKIGIIDTESGLGRFDLSLVATHRTSTAGKSP